MSLFRKNERKKAEETKEIKDTKKTAETKETPYIRDAREMKEKQLFLYRGEPSVCVGSQINHDILSVDSQYHGKLIGSNYSIRSLISGEVSGMLAKIGGKGAAGQYVHQWNPLEWKKICYDFARPYESLKEEWYRNEKSVGFYKEGFTPLEKLNGDFRLMQYVEKRGDAFLFTDTENHREYTLDPKGNAETVLSAAAAGQFCIVCIYEEKAYFVDLPQNTWSGSYCYCGHEEDEYNFMDEAYELKSFSEKTFMRFAEDIQEGDEVVLYFFHTPWNRALACCAVKPQ